MGLWSWRTAYSWRAHQPVTAVMIGSSNIHGHYSAGHTTAVETTVASMLAARFGGGASYLADHPGWATTGTTAVVNAGLSRFTRRLEANASMSRTMTCERVSVQHKQGPMAAGTFTVTIDGVHHPVAPSTTGSSERYDGVWTSPNLGYGQHTVTITAHATTTIGGVQAEVGGVRIVNAGHGGTAAQLYAQAVQPSRTHNRAVASLSPSLLIWMVGSNDWADYNGTSSAVSFKASTRKALKMVRAACPEPPSILLVHQHRRFDVTTPQSTWAEFGAALAELADELPDTQFLDASGAFPIDRASDVDRLIGPDGVHLTDRGSALLADLIGDAILAPQAPPVTSAPLPEADPVPLPGVLAAWRASDLTGTDGSAVTSWAPYTGTETSPLLPTGTAPVLRHNAHTTHQAVDVTGGRPLQTSAWSTTYTGPLTVLAVARCGTATTTSTGHLWSGRAGVYASLQLPVDNVVAPSAGGLSAPASQWTYAGNQAWQVYGVVYDGPGTMVYTHGLDPASVPLVNGSAYGLAGFTLGANSGGTGAYADAQYLEVVVYDRALTQAEMSSAVATLARRYHLDGSGRTSL
jgi:lysophospholipase L1-like esterase